MSWQRIGPMPREEGLYWIALKNEGTIGSPAVRLFYRNQNGWRSIEAGNGYEDERTFKRWRGPIAPPDFSEADKSKWNTGKPTEKGIFWVTTISENGQEQAEKHPIWWDGDHWVSIEKAFRPEIDPNCIVHWQNAVVPD